MNGNKEEKKEGKKKEKKGGNKEEKKVEKKEENKEPEYNKTKTKTNINIEEFKKDSKLAAKKIIYIFISIHNLLTWLRHKYNKFVASCSVLTQLTIFLIPFSLACILAIFFIHYHFFTTLYEFNFHKGIKEEFMDYYITEMDDVLSELDSFIIKENYIDTEDLLFFDVYYKELVSNGLLDNPDRRTIPNISPYSETLYKIYDDLARELNTQDFFTIPEEKARKNIDERKGDSIGELAKLYYYMQPIMGSGAFSSKIIINQTFFIAYEFEENRKIKQKELFFTIPRKGDAYNEHDNFTPSNYLLNPLIAPEELILESEEVLTSTSNKQFFYKENWFMMQDKKFRERLHLEKERNSIVSLAHLNYEYNGNINKSLIISSQQYIRSKNKYYMVNIIFFFEQYILDLEAKEYSTFVIYSNPNKFLEEKYSDNQTYVITKSDNIEYSLNSLDFDFFHYGFYDNKNFTYFQNGIFFDTINLDYLYNTHKFYDSNKDLKIDLKYLTTLFLFKNLFQSIGYKIIKKKREEIYLYNFNDEEKVKSICSEINFSEYKNYLKDSGIDCWSTENTFYYDEESFKNESLIDADSKYPYCSCLPLYCLENYLEINNDFNNTILASKINLPSKCQNEYKYYDSNTYDDDEKKHISISSSLIYDKIISNIHITNNEYLKIHYDVINKIQGYYLLVISQIKSSTHYLIFNFFILFSQMEVLILVLGISLISIIICLIIIYVNLRRYSVIIKEFVKKFELYVFHSDDGKIDNNKKEQNPQKYNNNSFEENKMERSNIFNDHINFSGKDSFNINENTLLEDLFTMFSKHYRISLKEVERYYSQQSHETKNQMKLKMMLEKNELFKLLSLFSIYAPIFKLNLSLDYKMYKYSKIIKRYNQYVLQVTSIDKEQTRLTQNILYELLSTENISDFGLITNLKFKYISNIRAKIKKKNSIQRAILSNVVNKAKRESNNYKNDEDEIEKSKLILKNKNELIEYFKNKFENDDYLLLNKIEKSFNFFLISSYYKYLNQIYSHHKY